MWHGCRRPALISVVVPVLDEARRLPALITGILEQGPAVECIVVDGGSSDSSAAVAAAAGAKVMQAPRGRGVQLRAGADAATGDILLFLHADCSLPGGALDRLAETLAERPELIGGNFRLVFDGDDRFSRWLDRFYARIRRLGLYYGDSAVFVRSDTYHRLGGIRPIELMEDYDFTRRIETFGPTCCIDDPPLVTSSRRFRHRHPVAIVGGWLLVHALYHLGVPPRWLASLYDSERRRRRTGHGAFKAQS